MPALWQSVIAGCDLTMCVNVSGRKGPNVAEPEVVVVVVGEAGVVSEAMTDLKTGRGIMAGATGEAYVALPILVATYVLMSSFHYSVRDIAPLHDLVRLRHVAERLPATALLVQVVLLVGLGPALPYAHVPVAHLRVVGCHRQEAHLLRHLAGGAARHRILCVTKSEIEEVEVVTVAVPRHVGDALVPPHVVVPPVEAQIHPVADAVQARVGAERIAPCRTTGLHRAAEGEGGTGAYVGAEAGVQRMGGVQKGSLVGVEAVLGAPVRLDSMGKVQAEDGI
jgi:hypothetical protein